LGKEQITLGITSISSLDQRLAQRIRKSIGELPVAIKLGDSDELLPAGGAPLVRVSIPDRGLLAKLAVDPEVAFGEAYTAGTIAVDGDLVRFLEIVLTSMKQSSKDTWFSKLLSGWLTRRQSNTLRGSARNIHHHYDLTTDFYRLWLDPGLVYTCAYFPQPSATLEEAQHAKMDYVCRKVMLQPGESVVEAGCGWGALSLHMARHYGVTVKAFNISKEQIRIARERARQEGLADRVEFIEDDYRNISGRFDAFVSVGMLEHVGVENYPDLARVIHRSIGDTGRGLLHFIGRNAPRPFSPWMRKRIFPGAYAPALSQVMPALEPWNFSVLDVENLRLHYALTLEHWLSRFEGTVERVTAMFDPEFVRAWRLYLAGSLASFRVGALQLFQVVFAGSQCARMPDTREHLYAQRALPQKEQQRWLAATS
jgi:cyclopropane-fatty-acyl-phospholipid synthase